MVSEGAHDATTAAALDRLAADLRAGWVDRADVVVKRADLALALGLARKQLERDAAIAERRAAWVAADAALSPSPDAAAREDATGESPLMRQIRRGAEEASAQPAWMRRELEARSPNRHTHAAREDTDRE